MSLGFGHDFDQAFEAYKEREKRRKSSLWKPVRIEEEKNITKKVFLLTVIITIPLLAILLFSIYFHRK